MSLKSSISAGMSLMGDLRGTLFWQRRAGIDKILGCSLITPEEEVMVGGIKSGTGLPFIHRHFVRVWQCRSVFQQYSLTLFQTNALAAMRGTRAGCFGPWVQESASCC